MGSMGWSALVFASVLACGSGGRPAPLAQGADPDLEELRVASDTVTLEVGQEIGVCVRSITTVFDSGGAFRCSSGLQAHPTPLGPGVSEAALWGAVTARGGAGAKASAAYVYSFSKGDSPRRASASSVQLYDGEQAPESTDFITDYVVKRSDGALAIYVGVVGG